MPAYSTPEAEEALIPGLIRRLAAILYDSLLLIALLFVATAIVTLPFGNPSGTMLLFFQFFIFEIIPLIFFTGFWARGGQTLGMRAWRLKLIRMDGGMWVGRMPSNATSPPSFRFWSSGLDLSGFCSIRKSSPGMTGFQKHD